jgi:hypothetical protein
MIAARYKTKKDLKAAVGKELRYTETSMFSAEFVANGKNYVVGPSPQERKWYAEVWCENGIITKVK